MPSDVHVSCHAEERFRARCAEGGPWPEFDIPQLKEWIADMVRANALDARYYYTPRGTAESIVVPLREEGVLLAVAICTKAWHRPPIVAVKTVYGPLQRGWAGTREGILPRWYSRWAASLQTYAR